jgi:hypothetical protein
MTSIITFNASSFTSMVEMLINLPQAHPWVYNIWHHIDHSIHVAASVHAVQDQLRAVTVTTTIISCQLEEQAGVHSAADDQQGGLLGAFDHSYENRSDSSDRLMQRDLAWPAGGFPDERGDYRALDPEQI